MRHPSFANIADLDEVAGDRHEAWKTLHVSKGVPIDWFVAAIGEAASDCAGTGMAPHEKVKRIRQYTFSPRRPKEPTSGTHLTVPVMPDYDDEIPRSVVKAHFARRGIDLDAVEAAPGDASAALARLVGKGAG